MKTRILLSLATCITCMAASAVAQVGFSVKEIYRSDAGGFIRVEQSNAAGWMLLSVSGAPDRDRKDELLGPGGYRRDISAFMQVPDSDISALAVTHDGAVYLERGAYSTTEEGTFLSERKLLKLDRDASILSEIISFKRDLTTDDGILVNAKGQILHYSANVADPAATITIRRINGTRESLQNFALPPIPKGKRQSLTVLLDDTGKFALSRSIYSSGNSTLSNLCSGSVDNESITCMDLKRLKALKRKGFYLSSLVNGTLLLSSWNISKSLDLITFDEKATLRISSRKTATQMSLISNGSVVTFASGIFKDSRDAKLFVSDSMSGKNRFSCDVIEQMRLPWLSQMELFSGVDGGIMVLLRDYGPKRTSRILLLAPASLSNELAAPAIGSCKPIN